jgi:hypothetical protein
MSNKLKVLKFLNFIPKANSVQDEVSAQLPGAFDNPNNAIRIHHSLASIASDYR